MSKFTLTKEDLDEIDRVQRLYGPSAIAALEREQAAAAAKAAQIGKEKAIAAETEVQMHINPSTSGTNGSRGRVPPKRPMLQTPEIETSNRFALLEDAPEIVPQPERRSNNQQSMDTDNVEQRSIKQSPIVAYGLNYDYKIFIQELQQFSRNFVTYPNREKKQVTIITFDRLEKMNIIKFLHTKNLTCHTYTDVEDKKRTYVIKGLDGEWSEEEVREDIESKGVSLLKLSKMRSTANFYIATTANNILLKDMQNIKHILHTKIRIEVYINKKQITQCKRCQRWGHVMANCTNLWTCVRCGDLHASYLCDKKDKQLHTAKCANCGEAHPSTSNKCVVYLQKLKVKESRRNELSVQRDPTTTRSWSNVVRKKEDSRSEKKIVAASASTEPDLLKELQNEIKTLNELVDIRKLLNMYKEINARLSQISDANEREMVFLEMLLGMQTV